MARVWADTDLDALGMAAATGAAVCLATFLLLGRHTGGVHEPLVSTFWTFAFASLFWVVVEPPWRVDGGVLADTTSLQGALDGIELPVWAVVVGVIVLGTLVPYVLDMAALRHLTAATAGWWACSNRWWPRWWPGRGSTSRSWRCRWRAASWCWSAWAWRNAPPPPAQRRPRPGGAAPGDGERPQAAA